jgi:carbonic anhydrase
MSQKQHGLIDNWIRHIKDAYSLHHKELEAIDDPELRENRFTEFNVIEQVYNLSQTSIIQNAWAKRHAPFVHGWVYDLHTGLIEDLNVSMNDNSTMMEVYKFETP